MIRELYINNFKSLLNFRVELSKFVCIIGMNGTGKSTLLQAIDFITQIFKGDLKTWLQAREWQSQDLLSDRASPSHKIFEVKLQFESTRYACYGEFNLNKLTCTKEKIINETSGDILFEVVNRSYRIGNHARKSIEFKYQGSALSALFSRSHALAWECSRDAPASRSSSLKERRDENSYLTSTLVRRKCEKTRKSVYF